MGSKIEIVVSEIAKLLLELDDSIVTRVSFVGMRLEFRLEIVHVSLGLSIPAPKWRQLMSHLAGCITLRELTDSASQFRHVAFALHLALSSFRMLTTLFLVQMTQGGLHGN